MIKRGAPPDEFGVLYHMVTYRISWFHKTDLIRRVITLWFLVLSQCFRDGMGPFKQNFRFYKSTLFAVRWIPESPRWLIQHKRIDEAKGILTQMALTNRKPIPDFSGINTFIQVIWKHIILQIVKKVNF